MIKEKNPLDYQTFLAYTQIERTGTRVPQIQKSWTPAVSSRPSSSSPPSLDPGKQMSDPGSCLDFYKYQHFSL